MRAETAEKMARMRELSAALQAASEAYYQESREIMPNIEYDRLYDELLGLEKEMGVTLSGSPTQKVGFEPLPELPKEEHEQPMLSLDKTKDAGALRAWLGDQKGLLSWKLDGLTIVLHYRGGSLKKAVTRGNGYIGEVITANARAFRNIPLTLAFQGELILRGEAVIRYSDFRRINRQIGGEEAGYKNPRNLCSGSVRQLDPKVTRARKVYFHAFSLVQAEGVDFRNSHEAEFAWLESLGFDVVERELVSAENVEEKVAAFEARIAENDLPSDGLVLLMDDIAYGESLGSTAKFPRNAIAFKWSDETRETTLREIEWSPSRTGLINPVAIFDPVELEGTTVSRASVHNVSILRALALGEGDRITVYKANMIIPQIAENLSRSGGVKIPELCPVCGRPTAVRNENGVETLHCENPDCAIKRIKRFALLASRDALNIEGLSEQTLEKLTAAGLVRDASDLFRLRESRGEIAALEGFGEKSAAKLISAAEKAAATDMARFVYGLGIPGIGVQNARQLTKHFRGDFAAFRAASEEELCEAEGVGPVLASAVRTFFDREENKRETDRLLQVLRLRESDAASEEDARRYAGKSFVITGALKHFPNRGELKRYIESRGGKTSDSVSARTSYLINNAPESSSGKNRKARELGIPVISEEEFLAL